MCISIEKVFKFDHLSNCAGNKYRKSNRKIYFEVIIIELVDELLELS